MCINHACKARNCYHNHNPLFHGFFHSFLFFNNGISNSFNFVKKPTFTMIKYLSPFPRMNLTADEVVMIEYGISRFWFFIMRRDEGKWFFVSFQRKRKLKTPGKKNNDGRAGVKNLKIWKTENLKERRRKNRGRQGTWKKLRWKELW